MAKSAVICRPLIHLAPHLGCGRQQLRQARQCQLLLQQWQGRLQLLQLSHGAICGAACSVNFGLERFITGRQITSRIATLYGMAVGDAIQRQGRLHQLLRQLPLLGLAVRLVQQQQRHQQWQQGGHPHQLANVETGKQIHGYDP